MKIADDSTEACSVAGPAACTSMSDSPEYAEAQERACSADMHEQQEVGSGKHAAKEECSIAIHAVSRGMQT